MTIRPVITSGLMTTPGGVIQGAPLSLTSGAQLLYYKRMVPMIFDVFFFFLLIHAFFFMIN